MKTDKPQAFAARNMLASVLVCFMLFSQGGAQTENQKTFATAKEAVQALVAALRSGDDAQLQSILGTGSEQIISSGDEVADKAARDLFVTKYDQKHSLVWSAQNELTLNVGQNDFPLPIPLVHANGRWYFDGVAGKEEIVYRRIGHNEIDAIQVCKGVVSAQRDYASTGHDGNPAGGYAPRLISEPGKQNGLYWETADGGAQSPGGPFLAQASAEGYDTSGKRTPYHGYYYRILKEQGSNARGGARDYVVNGTMTGGFALVAFPAEYRASGVMTFIVNQDGVVYQKDLGENTEQIASQLSAFNPDKTWKIAK